jgi:hypothetical protein
MTDDTLGAEAIPALRICGICGVRDIPRWVDWKTWHDGRPAHAECYLALTFQAAITRLAPHYGIELPPALRTFDVHSPEGHLLRAAFVLMIGLPEEL